MIELLDLQQTLHAFAACNDDDEVYGSFGWVHATEGDLLQARFWLPPDEDAAFDEDSEVPAEARALGLGTFLEPATFADVLDVQKRQRPLSSLRDYAQALAYYAEYDAFQQVEGIDEALGEGTGGCARGGCGHRHLRVLRSDAGSVPGGADQSRSPVRGAPAGDSGGRGVGALPRVAAGAG